MQDQNEIPVAVTFNPELFNARLKEEIPFSEKTLEQIKMLKEFNQNKLSFEDLLVIVNNVYDNIEDETFNQILFKTFKTKKNLNIFNNTDINVNLLNWNIGESSIPFHEIKYKTVTSERADAYKIIEDKSFASTKPELVKTLTNFKIFELRAKYTEDVTIMAYRAIFESLLDINKTLPYFFQYIVSKVLGLRQNITVNQLIKLSDKTLFEILCWLHYRNDKEFANELAWNASIVQKTKTEAIGYFTISDNNGTIGNFWIDDRFRNRGLASNVMEYIVTNLLPKHDYLFITTKNESMKKIINKHNGKYIGKCFPYSRIPNCDKNEFIYVFLNKTKFPTQEIPFAVIVELDSWKETAPEFSNVLFDKYEDKLKTEKDCSLMEMNTLQVYQEWMNPYSEFITILGVTKDESVLPEFKDTYQREKVVYWCLVVLDHQTNVRWYYPLTGIEGNKFQISLHEKFIERAKPFTMEVSKETSYDENFTETNRLKIVRNGSHPVYFEYTEFNTDIQIKSHNKERLYNSVKDFIESSEFETIKYGVDLHPSRHDLPEGSFLPRYLDGDGKVVLVCEEARQNKGIFDLI